MKRGRYSLKQELAELRAEVSRLKNQPAPKSTVGPSSAGQIDGTLIATLTGLATIGTSVPVEWSKVVSDGDDVGFDGSLIECDRDGSYTFGAEVAGVWPGGFHRHDWIDGVTVDVLPAGNMNMDPMRLPLPVNRGQVGRGVLNGYGNTLELGITSHTSHHAAVGGQSYAVPSGVAITLFVTRQMEG